MRKKEWILTVAAVFIFFIQPGRAAGGAMKLTSIFFNDGQAIPPRFTCQGDDINPELTIENIPSSAKTLVLIVDDPDAPSGNWVHWIVFDISPVSRIGENSIPGKQGLNSAGELSWHGPCPPSGRHRYFFNIYALDAVLNLKEGASRVELEEAMQGHILADARLLGTYEKKR
ncbi:MAG: YbhB/YbcL family Raf kinase inhibitor-like protein [Candidatus Omnitrophota bacterium]|jgi:hypothetical protein